MRSSGAGENGRRIRCRSARLRLRLRLHLTRFICASSKSRSALVRPSLSERPTSVFCRLPPFRVASGGGDTDDGDGDTGEPTATGAAEEDGAEVDEEEEEEREEEEEERDLDGEAELLEAVAKDGALAVVEAAAGARCLSLSLPPTTALYDEDDMEEGQRARLREEGSVTLLCADRSFREASVHSLAGAGVRSRVLRLCQQQQRSRAREAMKKQRRKRPRMQYDGSSRWRRGVEVGLCQ